MFVNPKQLRISSNTSIVNAIRNDASLDYQQRVPVTTKETLDETLKLLLDNRPQFNEFISALINRIGMVVLQSKTWTNPLAEFKRGTLEYGDTIEEIQVGLLKAKTYEPERDYMEKELFGQELPEVQVNFHRVNRQEYYKVTINHDLLKRAFLKEQGGLSGFLADLMDAPNKSNEVDEFKITLHLLSEYENNGGYFKVQVPDVAASNSGATEAKTALRRMREVAENMRFVSTKYNAAGMPSFADPNELVLITTPAFKAAVDVEALAAAFNIDYMANPGRIVTVPQSEVSINGFQAVLTTVDFFMIYDKLFQAEEIRNPAGLYTNYFLHVHQIFSLSRFVPAVLFTTTTGTDTTVTNTPVTGINPITVKDRNDTTVTSVTRGEQYAVQATAKTASGTSETGVALTLTGANSPRTYITASNVLYVAPDETSTSLVINGATLADDATSGTNDSYTTKKTLTVTGEIATIWPVANTDTPIPTTPEA